MRRAYLIVCVALALAGLSVPVKADTFRSDCGTLAISLPKGWEAARQKQLDRSTLEAYSGKSQLALYPYFSITTEAELARQLQSDRKLVLDNLKQPSGIGKMVSGRAAYYYFAWGSKAGIDTLGYLSVGNRFYHLIFKDARDYVQIKEVIAGAARLPDGAEPSFAAETVTVGPRDTALLVSLSRREYPQAETASKVLSLTRFNGAAFSLEEAVPDKAGAFEKLCAREEPNRKAVDRSTGTFANGWDFCRALYTGPGGDMANYYFRAGDLIYLAQAVNVPDAAVRRLLATGKTTSIVSGMAKPAANLAESAMSSASGGFPLPPEGNAAERPLSALPPLPDRPMGIQMKVIFALLGFTVLSFLLKLLVPPPDNPPFSFDPESPYPLRIERRYFSLSASYEAADAQERQYCAESPRIIELLTGLCAVVFVAAMLARMGLDLTGSPGAALAGQLGSCAFGCIFIFLALSVLVPKRLYLYTEDRQLVAYAVMRPVFVLAKTFVVFDPSGRQIALIIRPMFRPLRRWCLTDLKGEILFEMCEESAIKALLRKLFGHLWGMLRSSYVFCEGGETTGVFQKDWSLLNRYTLFIQNPPGVDYRLVLLLGMLADRIDPDRWYPWPN